MAPLRALLIALATAWPSLAQPAAACQVTPRATVPLQSAAGVFLLPVALNGTTADFVLDTGAERSVVGLAAADRLHLDRDPWVSTDISGAGGRDRRRLGRPASLSLAGIALRRHTVAADNSVVVGPIPDAIAGHALAGLLGQDFLSPFDLDLNGPAATLTLYSVTGCAGHFLPWAGRYAALPAWRPVRNILALPLRVGPVALQAELDSGAATTTLTLPGMVALGLRPGGPDQVSGFGPGMLPAFRRHFDTVQVGALPAAPADLVAAPIPTLHSIGALLGADWLRTRHVWISWSASTVFVAEP